MNALIRAHDVNRGLPRTVGKTMEGKETYLYFSGKHVL